nr:unnamed protein product [Naegleria fowleri]
MTLLLINDSSSSSLSPEEQKSSEFVHLIISSPSSFCAASSKKSSSSSDMLANVQTSAHNNECVANNGHHQPAPATKTKSRPLSMSVCKEGLSKLWKKETSSHGNIKSASTPASINSDASETSDTNKKKTTTKQNNKNRHSFSPANGSLRGKHPATRVVNTTQKNEEQAPPTKKKTKWLKYKGYDKKDINILKKDHFNGYIMLTIEVQDLISLGLEPEKAKLILSSLVDLSLKQDGHIEKSFDCEIILPSTPVKSTSSFSFD